MSDTVQILKTLLSEGSFVSAAKSISSYAILSFSVCSEAREKLRRKTY